MLTHVTHSFRRRREQRQLRRATAHLDQRSLRDIGLERSFERWEPAVAVYLGGLLTLPRG
jgi:Domain of unknown function (DUF1127)